MNSSVCLLPFRDLSRVDFLQMDIWYWNLLRCSVLKIKYAAIAVLLQSHSKKFRYTSACGGKSFAMQFKYFTKI